jgi:potassium efflux system protein
LLQVRRVILDSIKETQRNYWRVIVRLAAILLPLSILAVSFLGAIGYINLSWLIAQQLTLLLLVLTIWLIIRGFLGDFVTLWRERLAKKEGYGALWSEDLVPLIHKIISVILFVTAVIILLKISGWYSDTAFRQGIVDLWNFSLFTIGSTHVAIGNILLAILLLWVFMWLSSWSRGITYRWSYAGIADHGVRHSLSVFTQYAIIVVGLLIVLRTVGIDPTMLTVFAGAIGVGIGFGMQNVVNNFISGILLLIERPLKTGDVVDIGVYKEVTVGQIGIRSTTVKMPDKKELIVPNAEIISQSFVNWTRENMLLRIVSYIGVGYDDDLRLVEKILLEIMSEITGILRDPPFRILLWEFEESRITIRIEYHVDMSRGSYERVKSDMKFKMWERFREAGIKIPYPQRDVHLKPQSLKEDLLLQDELIVLPQTGGKT